MKIMHKNKVLLSHMGPWGCADLCFIVCSWEEVMSHKLRGLGECCKLVWQGTV